LRDNQSAPTDSSTPPLHDALPILPSEATANNGQQQQVQEQRRRINAMLQDYELQRRLHSEQLQFEQAQTQQAAVQVPGIQTLRTDRKSTRLNSSHVSISYAGCCLK